MEKEELIPILFNNCYGGYMISEKALNEYNKRKLKLDEKFIKITNCSFIKRIDPILFNIYKEFDPKDFNVNYSLITHQYIKKIYEKYYTINEYDGLECVGININQYKLDKIEEIINDTIKSQDEKIENIRNIIYKDKN